MGDDSSAEPPKPVIDYGTYALDQVPDWNEAAEHLIDLRRPPDQLLALFATPEIAMKYCANSLARRHSLAECGNHCIGCFGAENEFAVEVGWRVAVRVPASNQLFDARLRFPHVGADFLTFHPICIACYRSWRQRVRIGVMTLIGSGIVTTAIVIMVAVRDALDKMGRSWDPAYESIRFGTHVILPIGIFGCVVSILLEQVVWRRLPGSLRLQVHWAAKHTGHLKLIRRVG